MSNVLRLVEHDPAWAQRFAVEARRIADALGARASAIEHVGSTAVPGLAGKPVLDLAIAVTSEETADSCIEPLVRLGYEYRGRYGDDPRRRYYARDVEGQRFSQIHLYILPAEAWDEKLAFRDALRADPALAAAYAAEKRRVADAVGWDKTAYSLAKGPFIQPVLTRLRAEGRIGESPGPARGDIASARDTAPIRTIAVALCQVDDRILVERGHDRTSGKHFYRAIGGGVEFGERAADAVVREWREEFGVTLDEPVLLGVLENLFTYEGRASHEVVFAFSATVRDGDVRARSEFDAIDTQGQHHHAVWVTVEALRSGATPLYPAGILDMLTTSG